MKGQVRENRKKSGLLRREKPAYEQLIDLQDGRINVLLLGTSGCGKSTLINAVLGDELAKTGAGMAVTKDIRIYQKEGYPLRLIDTVGLEYSKRRQSAVRKTLSDYLRSGVKDKDADKIVHAIWFCNDGTVRRIDREVLNYIRDIAKIWPGAPIIVVFTKSYSGSEALDNIVMFRDVLDRYRKASELNIRDIIPVVAKAYPVAEDYIVAPSGIDTLVERTLRYGPEGIEGSRQVARAMDLKAKRSMSYSLIAAASALASVVGAVNIPVITHDAALLIPLQSYMMKRIASVYGVGSGDRLNSVIDSVTKAGAVTIAARATISAIGAIPGLQIAGAVVNSAVAAVFTFITGEVCLELVERVYTGAIDSEKVNWAGEAEKAYTQYAPKIIEALGRRLGGKAQPLSTDDIIKILGEIIAGKDNKEGTDLP